MVKGAIILWGDVTTLTEQILLVSSLFREQEWLIMEVSHPLPRPRNIAIVLAQFYYGKSLSIADHEIQSL